MPLSVRRATRDSLVSHLKFESTSQSPAYRLGANFCPQSFPQSRKRQSLHTFDDTSRRRSPFIGFLTRSFRESATSVLILPPSREETPDPV